MEKNSNTIKPLGNYPPLRRAGEWLYVSGMSARQADGQCAGVLREADGSVTIDVALQTRVVIGKIRDALAGEGATLSDCVSLTCYLTDMRDFDAYNRAYGEHFSIDGPARTTIAVHQLPHPDMRIEITATACLGTRQ
ncbi:MULTISPECIES: RidA family protein [Polaromonas]|uniref:RidA family protein n=1 Tax=Polaromonas aquatica TaxID=332657 RepID=A0ABW1TZA5_9BURK